MSIGLERLQGIEQAAQSSGASIERVDMEYDLDQANQVVARWREEPRPSAVFAYNDEYAMVLMRAIQDAGLRIPQDIAIVGCDNMPLCRMLRPQLTSVQLSSQPLGPRVADLLATLIHDDHVQHTLLNLLDPQLVVRDST